MQLIQGDTLQVLRTFDSHSFDGVITDPPYASGGPHAVDRKKPTEEKYSENAKAPDFLGESMDARSWTNWASEWLSECMRVTRPGNPIVLWDKRAARPRLSGFRQRCEFILWGYNGKMPAQSLVGYLPGFYSFFYEPQKSGSTRLKSHRN